MLDRYESLINISENWNKPEYFKIWTNAFYGKYGDKMKPLFEQYNKEYQGELLSNESNNMYKEIFNQYMYEKPSGFIFEQKVINDLSQRYKIKTANWLDYRYKIDVVLVDERVAIQIKKGTYDHQSLITFERHVKQYKKHYRAIYIVGDSTYEIHNEYIKKIDAF